MIITILTNECITLILQHTSSYMFWALLAHHQGAHNCTQQLLNIFCMQMLVCCNIIVLLIQLSAIVGLNCNN
jgi:hypothetical protein